MNIKFIKLSIFIYVKIVIYSTNDALFYENKAVFVECMLAMMKFERIDGSITTSFGLCDLN